MSDEVNGAPKPETGPGPNSHLLGNFNIVNQAVRDNQVHAIIGVAVLKNGTMIDLFGTSGELMMEYAAMCRVENLRDNMKSIQESRLQENARRQRAARQAEAVTFPKEPPAPPEQAPAKPKQRSKKPKAGGSPQ